MTELQQLYAALAAAHRELGEANAKVVALEAQILAAVDAASVLQDAAS